LYHRNGIEFDCFGLVGPSIPLPTFNSTVNDFCLDSRDAIVAWKIGEHFDLACLGDFGASISTAPTLYDALKAFEIGFCTIQTESQASLLVEDNVAIFEYRITAVPLTFKLAPSDQYRVDSDPVVRRVIVPPAPVFRTG